jgi:hypothetical protein
MKPRPRQSSQQAARSALVNSLTAPMTNLIALSQTLASGRVARRMVRDYALMCAIEASRLTRLVETFVMKELKARSRNGAVKSTPGVPATPVNPTTSRRRRRASSR